MKKISFCGGDLGASKELKSALEFGINNIETDLLLSYPDPQGLKELRDRIADIFGVGKKEVLITNSATESLFLTLSVTGKSLLLQNPSYFGINRQALDLKKKVNTWGNINELEEKIINTKNQVIYLTSNFSSIDGTSLSDNEKNKLIQIVDSTESLIIEDNPSDLLYFGDKPNSLVQMSDLVIYVGTLAKILGPGLALGFIIGNSDMIKKIKSKKITVSLRSSTSSMLIAEKALSTDYLSYLRKQHYNKWKSFRENLVEFGFDFVEPKGGVFAQVNLRENINLPKLIIDIEKKGIKIENNKHYFFDGKTRPFLRFNFVKNSIEDNKKGLLILSELIKTGDYTI